MTTAAQPPTARGKAGRPFADSFRLVKVRVRGTQLTRIEEAAGEIPLGQYLLLCEEELHYLRQVVLTRGLPLPQQRS